MASCGFGNKSGGMEPSGSNEIMLGECCAAGRDRQVKFLRWRSVDFCFELESTHRTGAQLPAVEKIAIDLFGWLAVVMCFSQEDSAVRVLCKPLLDETDKEKRAETLGIFQSAAGVIKEAVAKLRAEKRGIAFPF